MWYNSVKEYELMESTFKELIEFIAKTFNPKPKPDNILACISTQITDEYMEMNGFTPSSRLSKFGKPNLFGQYVVLFEDTEDFNLFRVGLENPDHIYMWGYAHEFGF